MLQSLLLPIKARIIHSRLPQAESGYSSFETESFTSVDAATNRYVELCSDKTYTLLVLEIETFLYETHFPTTAIYSGGMPIVIGEIKRIY